MGIALLAGVLGLDVVSFPQAMISRPIVGATLGGLLFGAPFAGMVCGAALECLALEALPVGASRYPEWGSASVVAGAVRLARCKCRGLAAPWRICGGGGHRHRDRLDRWLDDGQASSAHCVFCPTPS